MSKDPQTTPISELLSAIKKTDEFNKLVKNEPHTTLKKEYDRRHVEWLQEIQNNGGIVDLKSPKNPGYFASGEAVASEFDKKVFEQLAGKSK